MADTPGRTVSTTVTSFRIIEALRDHEQAGVSELARHLDLSKGTVHKHLTTLESLDYVLKDEGTYRLGLGFLGLGTVTRGRLDIYRAARPRIERLAEATEETASLMVLEHGYGRYVFRAPYGDDDLPHLEGERVYLHAAAAGKALLSYLPPDDRARIIDEVGLPEVTENTITDRDTFEDEIRTIRDTRTAYDREEQIPGWQCIASPITDTKNQSIAAISVSAPTDVMRERRQNQDIPGLLLSTANSIETRFRSV